MPDAGDTGLDCYEPEFFNPRCHGEEGLPAQLTITHAGGRVARRSLLLLPHPLEDEW